MRFRRCAGWVVVGVLLAGPAGAVAADDAKEAEKALAEKGIRKLGTALSLPEETEFSKMFREANKLKRDVTAAQKEQDAAEGQEAKNKQLVVQYLQQRQQISARLRQNLPAAQHNALVAQYNDLADQINLLNQTDLTDQLRTVRAKTNEAREAYVSYLMQMRELADAIGTKYSDLGVDPEVREAIERLNAATGKKYELAESRSFQTNLRNLRKLEDTVLSESVELVDEGSGTFMLPVTFNGKHTKELTLDSGASIVSLPYEMASEMGLKPGSDAPVVILSLADGSMIEGRRITIPEVRVGKFTVEEVEGVVLPQGLPNPPALLGMSFLSNFDFKVDSARKTLTMTKVETEEEPARGKKPTARGRTGAGSK